MNYSKWLKDFHEQEDLFQQDKAAAEDKKDTPIKKSKCLACWFEDCRCKAGLDKKKI